MNEILRHFFRCHDCLSVFAIEKAIFNCDRDWSKNEYDRWETAEGLPIVCPCGGEVVYIGPVTKHHVHDTEEVSACDGRCTEAKGNSCNCVCGGENHGTGKYVTISVRQDIDAPKQKGIDYDYAKLVRERRETIRKPFELEISQIKKGIRVENKKRWWAAKRTMELLHEAHWAFSKSKRDKLFKKAEELRTFESVRM